MRGGSFNHLFREFAIVGVRCRNISGVEARPSLATTETSLLNSLPEEFAQAENFQDCTEINPMNEGSFHMNAIVDAAAYTVLYEPSDSCREETRIIVLTGFERKERKVKGYKPCTKSLKCVIFHVVVGAEPLARSQLNLDHLFIWSTSSTLPNLITVTSLVWTWRGSKFSIFLCVTLRLIQQG
jgi:hypothetical protein